MAAKTDLEQEFIDLVRKADNDSVVKVRKMMLLTIQCPDFKKAVAAATPPGEVNPPLSVLEDLINEYAEREGI